jgi:hypothetical protein
MSAWLNLTRRAHEPDVGGMRLHFVHVQRGQVPLHRRSRASHRRMSAHEEVQAAGRDMHSPYSANGSVRKVVSIGSVGAVVEVVRPHHLHPLLQPCSPHRPMHAPHPAWKSPRRQRFIDENNNNNNPSRKEQRTCKTRGRVGQGTPSPPPSPAWYPFTCGEKYYYFIHLFGFLVLCVRGWLQPQACTTGGRKAC